MQSTAQQYITRLLRIIYEKEKQIDLLKASLKSSHLTRNAPVRTHSRTNSIKLHPNSPVHTNHTASMEGGSYFASFQPQSFFQPYGDSEKSLHSLKLSVNASHNIINDIPSHHNTPTNPLSPFSKLKIPNSNGIKSNQPISTFKPPQTPTFQMVPNKIAHASHMEGLSLNQMYQQSQESDREVGKPKQINKSGFGEEYTTSGEPIEKILPEKLHKHFKVTSEQLNQAVQQLKLLETKIMNENSQGIKVNTMTQVQSEECQQPNNQLIQRTRYNLTIDSTTMTQQNYSQSNTDLTAVFNKIANQLVRITKITNSDTIYDYSSIINSHSSNLGSTKSICSVTQFANKLQQIIHQLSNWKCNKSKVVSQVMSQTMAISLIQSASQTIDMLQSETLNQLNSQTVKQLKNQTLNKPRFMGIFPVLSLIHKQFDAMSSFQLGSAIDLEQLEIQGALINLDEKRQFMAGKTLEQQLLALDSNTHIWDIGGEDKLLDRLEHECQSELEARKMNSNGLFLSKQPLANIQEGSLGTDGSQAQAKPGLDHSEIKQSLMATKQINAHLFQDLQTQQSRIGRIKGVIRIVMEQVGRKEREKLKEVLSL